MNGWDIAAWLSTAIRLGFGGWLLILFVTHQDIPNSHLALAMALILFGMVHLEAKDRWPRR